MVKRSENITHRLFNRQLSCKPSGSQLQTVRTLYENIVPSHTVYDVECPDHTFRKFTNDGQYLIAFTRSFQHLVVYRFNWLNFCVKGEAEDAELPPKAAKFESFFTELYCVALATGTETICKDFFLTTENGVYGLFATSTGPDADAASVQGAVPGVPSIEKIKILAVRLADGIITDDRIYHDDFIHLSHNMGVFMYEDLLAILSVRFQCVHILQIRDSGTFVDVRSVGDFCQEDDELLISSQTQKEAWYQSTQAVLHKEDETTESRTSLEKDSKILRDDRNSRNYNDHDSSHIPVGSDFECYFRGLLGASSSGAGTSSQGVTELPMTYTAYTPLILSYDMTGARHGDQNQQSSVNNANAQRRTDFVLSSRTPHQQDFEARSELGHVDDSSGLTLGTTGEAGQNVTPVSSSGSRHVSGGRNIWEPAYAHSRDHHSSSIEATTTNVSTPVTSSRNDVVHSLPRAVPRSLSESNARSGREQSNSSSETGPPVLGGIKQRLLSFIFRSILEHDDDHVQRAQRLKRFYYHFQHYTELVMWKVQFLDRYHLLIKFGSADGVISRSCDVSQQLAFFVVYNFETTEILEFQQNSSQELLQLFENFADHFRSAQRYPVYMNYVTSFSNNVFVREQSREQKVACINTKASNKANSFAHIARRTLASLPVNSQSQSPSVYFDHSLFHFDEKLISATDRHKPSMEHPIKFLSRRRPHILKFKINPGPENGANETRIKRVAAFVFHPIFPFAISIQQSFLQASVVNFHFRK
ncbi:hypothetical protein SELMODRAFT_167525 [Selaginella moellendorffii]|uniref:Uncharacterized protein DET1-1 n=1 Tax=Selaginella moellendorffii TaxID=88036 RepID=D8R2X9_SELML|nr:light-mediated development protein DET1 isoform X2 [Selaginella moellendorffii]EFJ32844.1 hypothetical protein SELMODRAFT_167525 [Selaginella moellendorffii]|eukprot:XP_002965424.1 light-mediated development protein DET1 isoform X2 [Selaginella moellendorffii]